VGGTASPLGQALARLGLEPDDIGAVSIHGTSTEANDKNEAELHQLIAESLGRSPALPLPIIAQKALSGHSKGGAAAWQLIGLAQTLIDDTLPALSNLEDPSPDLAARLPLVFPDRPTPASLGRAGLLTSLGFGHVGAAVLVAHPDVLLETLPPADLAAYGARREERWKARLVADAQIRAGLAPFVPPAGPPPSPERFVAELRAAGSPPTAQVQGGQNP
jgi:fatty acid synthase